MSSYTFYDRRILCFVRTLLARSALHTSKEKSNHHQRYDTAHIAWWPFFSYFVQDNLPPSQNKSMTPATTIDYHSLFTSDEITSDRITRDFAEMDAIKQSRDDSSDPFLYEVSRL